MDKLRTWLKVNKITQASFAESIGRNQSRVSQILSNGTDSLNEALAIENATGGAVKASDLSREQAGAA